MRKFSSPVIKALNNYVYIYSHPITNEIFYVGKGKGNRIFSHLEEQSDSLKVKYLADLASNGLKPKLEILIHGLEDQTTALRVESSIIDLLGIENLTNKQSGYHSATFGRMSLKQINALYDKETIEVDDPAILIRINQAFRYTMSEIELYDYTRGHWVLNPERAKNAKYGIAVYEGIIQEVYKIIDWFPAGTTYSVRQGNENIKREELEGLENRYEFIGNLAPQHIREKYKFKSVEHYFKQGNSNPIMYKNA
ncbi:LEM-3-like GIY-YIG domain-containing protein [Roseivirga pacifica]|uniref:LEM-3-like GIY-YIG domain-containing protein n=1 Tax=Roseivirga pacifica TaxID=1267423 RepID=UPI00227C2B19|nr:hypothetical protein [Roseivirga pacifica]